MASNVLDQHAGVEWQDVYRTGRGGRRQNQMEEIVVRFLSISHQTSVMSGTLTPIADYGHPIYSSV